jgi:hypothetical protein
VIWINWSRFAFLHGCLQSHSQKPAVIVPRRRFCTWHQALQPSPLSPAARPRRRSQRDNWGEIVRAIGIEPE